MSTESPSLGERIRTLRTERKLSMRALAQAAGLKSVAFVADLERGFRHPSPDVLAALAKALSQPLESLRRYDMRPPVHELRALTAREPDWAIALRKLVDAAQSRSITPDRLIQMIDKAPRTAAKTKPAPAPVAEPTVTPPLFGS